MQTEEHKEFQVEISSQRETKQKLWDNILMVPDKDIESCENLNCDKEFSNRSVWDTPGMMKKHSL